MNPQVQSESPRVGVAIFDMDGTLTKPQLDFDRIRQEIGLDGVPILEAMEAMSPEERARTEAILHRHEAEAAATSELQLGAARVVSAIRDAGILEAQGHPHSTAPA